MSIASSDLVEEPLCSDSATVSGRELLDRPIEFEPDEAEHALALLDSIGVSQSKFARDFDIPIDRVGEMLVKAAKDENLSVQDWLSQNVSPSVEQDEDLFISAF